MLNGQTKGEGHKRCVYLSTIIASMQIPFEF